MLKYPYTVPGPRIVGRHPENYNWCVASCIALVVANIAFLILLMVFLTTHDYTIITEGLSCAMVITITFGIFIGLATLYTICLNENAYYHIREPFIIMDRLYVGVTLVWVAWMVLFDSDDPSFEYIVIPGVIEAALAYAVSHFFETAYDFTVNSAAPVMYQPIYRVPMQMPVHFPQMNFQPPMNPAQIPVFPMQPYPQY
eukprot:TRINITY_DN5060_c0_g1_i6.p1 TRINITY_DN5060_c0_g1~~TRINITY_DN5060_c0_g1_i6.p1  ORF type:complete len:199 (-),score=54.05 TRINITY_DN5060_c0_g1_i6:218-814(-)